MTRLTQRGCRRGSLEHLGSARRPTPPSRRQRHDRGVGLGVTGLHVAQQRCPPARSPTAVPRTATVSMRQRVHHLVEDEARELHGPDDQEARRARPRRTCSAPSGARSARDGRQPAARRAPGSTSGRRSHAAAPPMSADDPGDDVGPGQRRAAVGQLHRLPCARATRRSARNTGPRKFSISVCVLAARTAACSGMP